MKTSLNSLKKLVRQSIKTLIDEVRYIDTSIDGNDKSRTTKKDPVQVFNQDSIKDVIEHKPLLREFMEVWRDKDVDNIAKQIYADFHYAALTGDKTAKKKYKYTLKDGSVCNINVSVNPDSTVSGSYNHSNTTLIVNVGPDISLENIRRTLFHELTHSNDFVRKDQGKNTIQKGVHYAVNGRQTKLTELVNRISYFLFDTSERNAWQAIVVNGKERVDSFVADIQEDIKTLSIGSFKYEDQLFPNACKILFGKTITDWKSAKSYFIEQANKQFDKHKRRLYKNLLAYKDVQDDNMDGITPDKKLARQSHGAQMAYAEFITQSVEVIADDIIRHYISTVGGFYDAELDTKPFTLKYTPYGDKVNIKVLNYLRRPRATGFNGKELIIWPMMAISEIEACANCVLKRNADDYRQHYNTALKQLVDIIVKSCPQHWNVRG